jgi:hypothetical protein
VSVDPPKITDWRQSWGQLDTSKADAAGTPKPDATKTETVSKSSKPVAAPPLVTPVPAGSKMDLAGKPVIPVGPPVADTRRPDPLKDPVTFLHATPDDKSLVKPVEDRSGRGDLAKADAGPGKAPLGTQSVLEAGAPQYVPVPIVTVPDYRRVPQPPAAQVPQAPEPNRFDPTNAFTNPAPAAAAPQQQPMVPVAANAFTDPAPPQDPTVAAGGAFGGMAPGSPPRGMYPPGYGPRMPMAYPPPGYNPMARGMYPPPYGPPGYPMNPAAMAPAGYLPNPAAAGPGVRPVSYQVAMANPAQPGTPGTPGQPSEVMATLRDSIYPSQREWAATTLANGDTRTQPDAIHALMTAAREDPAPTVRAACVRGLVKMKAGTAPVIAALQAMKNDGDPRVLHEVETALATLNQEKMSR